MRQVIRLDDSNLSYRAFDHTLLYICMNRMTTCWIFLDLLFDSIHAQMAP